jgi:UrcA family protein
MTLSHKSNRRAAVATLLGALALGSALPASAGVQERFPEVRLVYGDLRLDTATGRQALVARVQATATDHCARYGTLIMPHERQRQPRYCIHAVRGDILRALPRPVREAYDLGRKATGDGA